MSEVKKSESQSGVGESREEEAVAKGQEEKKKSTGDESEEEEVPQDWAPLWEHSKITPEVGEVYDFEDELGQGAFSTVVLGRHLKTGERYAIKLIERARLDNVQRCQRVLTEISILSQCDHPHIMKIIEIYEGPLEVSLILPLMEGGELFDVVAHHGKVGEADASRMMRQLLTAVDYLHERGICHRDLKPENILCTSRDVRKANLKVTDFGLAKFGKDCLETPCGTTNYAAPEIGVEDFYDNSVDLWALGCVLYFMLFGRPPFDGEDDEEIRDLVSDCIYEFPQDVHVSASAKDLIEHLLEQDPSVRFTAKQALGHCWIAGGAEGLVGVAESAANEEVETPVGPQVVVNSDDHRNNNNNNKGGDDVAPGADKDSISHHHRPPITTTTNTTKGNINFSDEEKRKCLKSSMNRAIDVQRDGMCALQPVYASSIAIRREQAAAAQRDLTKCS
jgi:serine/threonine protein kinase